MSERNCGTCAHRGSDPAASPRTCGACDLMVYSRWRPIRDVQPLPSAPAASATTPSALAVQVAGSHYKDMKIQPMEYSMANGLDACQHTAIKYISRFRSKGGIEDLRKAIHIIEMLIEFEEKK